MDQYTLCVLFVLCSLTYASKLIRVDFSNEAENERFRKFTEENNIDDWLFRNDFAVVVVSESEEHLVKSSFMTEELISDVEKVAKEGMDENTRARRKYRRLRVKEAPTKHFATNKEINEWLQNIDRELSFAQVRSIGKTFEGRDMQVLRIGIGDEKKPAIFIQSAIHAREWLAPATVIYFIDKLIKGQQAGEPRITQLIEKYDWYFLVIANPDGYEYTFGNEKARLWRKTRSKHHGGEAIGVDPNRNFDVEFGKVAENIGPISHSYPGPYPFSEKCTANIRNFVLDCSMNGRIKLYYDVHTFGQFYLVPYAYDKTVKPDDDTEMRRVAQLSNAALYAVNKRTFRIGIFGELLYNAPGTSMDWLKIKANAKYSYTFELSPEMPEDKTDRKKVMQGFLCKPDDIEPSGKEISEAILTAVEKIQIE